jgi:hypothetical protein
LVEDEDPKTFTQFEQAWEELNTRLRIWTLFKRADILAGIGRYSIILIGAPGNLDEPLEKVAAKDIAYLTPFAEEDATIERFDIDTNSPRFGQPTFYTIKRTQAMTPDSSNSTAIGKRAHWTRVIHVADGLLDDPIFGTPRLERCWNLLDDLEKVTGGGAEAFWNRSNQGTQFDIDPTLNPSAAELESLKEQVEKYKHGLDRVLTTRGLKINTLGSDVANFSNPIDAIISQICTGIGIPQRILMGSERGQLASTQDRDSWFERVGARRTDFAEPNIVRPFVARLHALGALPTVVKFDVRWSVLGDLDAAQTADIAVKYAQINNQMGETVVTADEIRDRILKLPPLAEAAGISAAVRRGRALLSRPEVREALASGDREKLKQLIAAATKATSKVLAG